MTTEEMFEQMESQPEIYADTHGIEYLVIDNNLRTITIPPSVKIIGVESDDGVRRLHFRMPRVCGEFDLSEFDIRINYINANNVGDAYTVEDKEVSGDGITFSWVVGRNAAARRGNTKFNVCLKLKNESGDVIKEFNTTVAQLPTLEGLETTELIVQDNPDIIEQILEMLKGLTPTIKTEATENGTKVYITIGEKTSQFTVLNGTASEEDVYKTIDKLIEEGKITDSIIRDGSLTTKKYSDKSVTYDKMNLISEGTQNVLDIEYESQNVSKAIDLNELNKMLKNNDSFYLKMIQIDDFIYASAGLSASIKCKTSYEFSKTYDGGDCPRTFLVAFKNSDGKREYYAQVKLSDYQQWLSDVEEWANTTNGFIAGSIEIKCRCAQARIGSSAIIGRIDSYGNDYVVYDEVIAGDVDAEFRDLVKSIVGSSSPSDSVGEDLATVEKIMKAKLENKVFIALGDSYTVGMKAQLATLASKYGMIIDNRGIVSSSVSGDTSGNKGFRPMWSRADGIVSDYTASGGYTIGSTTYTADDVALITFMGGANDGFGISTWIGSGLNDTDTNHIYGATQHILNVLQENFPNAVVVVITQPSSYNRTVSSLTADSAQVMGFASINELQKMSDVQFSNYAMELKEEAIKRVAWGYGTAVIDMFNEFPSMFSPANRGKYWTSDKLHLTEAGYKIITDAIEKKMTELFV